MAKGGYGGRIHAGRGGGKHSSKKTRMRRGNINIRPMAKGR